MANKFLSYDGEHIFINHVLQSMPIYLLSVMNPFNKMVDRIHQIIVAFFWSKVGGEKGKHWVKWEDLCLSYKEDGISFRSLHDASKAYLLNYGGTLELLWLLYGATLCGTSIVKSCTL